MRRAVLAVVLALVAAGSAQAQIPLNDLEGAAELLYGQTPEPMPWQRSEPELAPVPRAKCDAKSRPLKGMQGRVPKQAIDSPEAAKGWTCNLRVISRYPTPGGFRTWRYVDQAGNTCVFYDTSLMGPLNVVSLAAAPSPGVEVLDMSDPRRPKHTALLTEPAMLSPHESLNLNYRRGLLAAEPGTGATAPGYMAIYDVKSDCRYPVLLSNYFASPVGHESGFSRDGKTFWIGGGQGIVPVDVSDPRNPFTLTTVNIPSHGINLSKDGNTLYQTNALDGGMGILDVSEVQARKPNPQVREISRLTWETTSIPQNTNPITIKGKAYLLEYDEFAFRFNPPTANDLAGAARLISISDPKHPRVVSNLRLDINMPDNHRAYSEDPSFVPGSPTSYGAHYCNVPRAKNPVIAACSFLNSGLRIFDIRRPRRPREVAYFVSPPADSTGGRADAAFSQPAFDAKRRLVYFTDAASGFWSVKLNRRAWPR